MINAPLPDAERYFHWLPPTNSQPNSQHSSEIACCHPSRLCPAIRNPHLGSRQSWIHHAFKIGKAWQGWSTRTTFRILTNSRDRVRATNHPKHSSLTACWYYQKMIRTVLYEIKTNPITHLSYATTLCRPEIWCFLPSKSSSNWNQKSGLFKCKVNMLSITLRIASGWDTLQF